MRNTKHREEILKILDKSKTTLSASQIHELLPAINLVTIYRNLDKFVTEGLVKKLHFDNQETLYEKQHDHHHHAICDNCEKVIHFSLSDEKIISKIKIPDFTISSVDIIVRGTCENNHKITTSKSRFLTPKGKINQRHR